MKRVKCPRCKGDGKIVLRGVLAKTLDIMRSFAGDHYATALAYYADCTPSAMANRLHRLEEFGAVTSKRLGTVRMYRAK